MPKTVLFDGESREKVLKGLRAAAKAVGGTIGPNGRNVLIEQPYGDLATNDGTTVASSIEFRDKQENLGANIVKNASAKTNDDVGDGTTTTAVLLESIIEEALKRPENPMEIRNSLLEAQKDVIKAIRERTKPAKKSDIESVAVISAENEEIAKLIVNITKKLGENAVINIEDAKTYESSSEIMPGYDAPVGFVSPYFINEKATGRAVFENVHVLVAEKKMSSLVDLKPIADIFQRENIGQCVFVVDDMDESLIGLLVKNNLNGVFKSVIIRARGEILEDIAGAVGATPVADRNGLTFQNIELKYLGKADKVCAEAHKTIFFAESMAGKVRAAELEGMAETEQNMYRKEKLKDRAAKLRGGVGVIRIGASGDYERNYLKLKAEDAVKAVQAASEGICEGGGITLWRTANELEPKTPGHEILKKSLVQPFKKILENGGQDYLTVASSIMNEDRGFNARTGEYVNMFEAGIIDPAKVERMAVQNAISAAANFITIFCSITETETKP